MIRNFRDSDIELLKKIHERQYKFPFPDFDKNFIMKFVDEVDGKIITGGGIRSIAEGILITDKSAPLKARGHALKNSLQVMLFAAENYGYSQIHAFLKDDPVWKRALLENGFEPCNSETLFLNV